MERLDEFGGPDSYNHYAVGWAHAMDTPYQWTKQVASHFGGTRNGTIVHWPAGFEAKGEIRTQFTHVIDIAPTVLDAAGLAEPTFVNGVQQKPIAGREHALRVRRRGGRRAPRDAVLRDVRQPRHLPQGLDRGHAAQDAVAARRRAGARVRRRRLGALRHQRRLDAVRGRLGAASRAAPRAAAAVPDRGDPHTTCCRSTTASRSGCMPEVAGRPVLVKGNRQRLFGGMGRLSESSVVSIKNKSHAVTAEIVVPEGGAQGVIIAQGGSIGGWSLYAEGRAAALLLQPARRPALLRRQRRASSRPARTRCGWSSTTTARGSARAAPCASSSTASRSARAPSRATAAMIFSADDTCDVGKEDGALVAEDYPVPNAFTGEVRWVEIDVGRRRGRRRPPARPRRAAPRRDGASVAPEDLETEGVRRRPVAAGARRVRRAVDEVGALHLRGRCRRPVPRRRR